MASPLPAAGATTRLFLEPLEVLHPSFGLLPGPLRLREQPAVVEPRQLPARLLLGLALHGRPEPIEPAPGELLDPMLALPEQVQGQQFGRAGEVDERPANLGLDRSAQEPGQDPAD